MKSKILSALTLLALLATFVHATPGGLFTESQR